MGEHLPLHACDRRGGGGIGGHVKAAQAPTMALKILDDAVQAQGGVGVSDYFCLANAWASVRTLHLADGPDEVHSRAIARAEFARYAEHATPRPQQH
jgi:acyl-CoA dehydrogenase